jgi:hypothetical protein
MKRAILFTIITLAASSVLFADEAPPPKAKPTKAKIQIIIDQNAKDSKLVISRETLQALLDSGEGRGALASPIGVSRSQTIFGGLLLSASFVFGGVWLARRKEGGGVIPAAGAVVAVVCGAAILAMGNAAPPIYQRIDSSLFSEGLNAKKFAHGDILVEIDPDDISDGVKLIIAPEKKPGKDVKKNN